MLMIFCLNRLFSILPRSSATLLFCLASCSSNCCLVMLRPCMSLAISLSMSAGDTLTFSLLASWAMRISMIIMSRTLRKIASTCLASAGLSGLSLARAISGRAFFCRSNMVMTCPLTTAATLLSWAACTPHAATSMTASSKTSVFLTGFSLM